MANCIVLALEDHLPSDDKTLLTQNLVSWLLVCHIFSSEAAAFPTIFCPHTCDVNCNSHILMTSRGHPLHAKSSGVIRSKTQLSGSSWQSQEFFHLRCLHGTKTNSINNTEIVKLNDSSFLLPPYSAARKSRFTIEPLLSEGSSWYSISNLHKLIFSFETFSVVIFAFHFQLLLEFPHLALVIKRSLLSSINALIIHSWFN